MVTSKNKKFFNNDGSKYKFDFENFVKCELGFGKKTVTKKSSEICQDFLRGICKRKICKYQHKVKRVTVCKHWLRGLCMKGDEQCEYLHEYDLSKMPKCVYYTLYGACNLPHCIYSHDEVHCERCDWYDRGFCKKGPTCLKRHVKQVVCQLYLTGFCPRGPYCLNGHPKMSLINDQFSLSNKNICNKQEVLCVQSRTSLGIVRRNVTCFKCGKKGHFARNCSA